MRTHPPAPSEVERLALERKRAARLRAAGATGAKPARAPYTGFDLTAAIQPSRLHSFTVGPSAHLPSLLGTPAMTRLTDIQNQTARLGQSKPRPAPKATRQIQPPRFSSASDTASRDLPRSTRDTLVKKPPPARNPIRNPLVFSADNLPKTADGRPKTFAQIAADTVARARATPNDKRTPEQKWLVANAVAEDFAMGVIAAPFEIAKGTAKIVRGAVVPTAHNTHEARQVVDDFVEGLPFGSSLRRFAQAGMASALLENPALVGLPADADRSGDLSRAFLPDLDRGQKETLWRDYVTEWRQYPEVPLVRDVLPLALEGVRGGGPALRQARAGIAKGLDAAKYRGTVLEINRNVANGRVPLYGPEGMVGGFAPAPVRNGAPLGVPPSRGKGFSLGEDPSAPVRLRPVKEGMLDATPPAANGALTVPRPRQAAFRDGAAAPKPTPGEVLRENAGFAEWARQLLEGSPDGGALTLYGTGGAAAQRFKAWWEWSTAAPPEGSGTLGVGLGGAQGLLFRAPGTPGGTGRRMLQGGGLSANLDKLPKPWLEPLPPETGVVPIDKLPAPVRGDVYLPDYLLTPEDAARPRTDMSMEERTVRPATLKDLRRRNEIALKPVSADVAAQQSGLMSARNLLEQIHYAIENDLGITPQMYDVFTAAVDPVTGRQRQGGIDQFTAPGHRNVIAGASRWGGFAGDEARNSLQKGASGPPAQLRLFGLQEILKNKSDAILGNIQSPALYVAYLQTQGLNPAYTNLNRGEVHGGVTAAANTIHQLEANDLLFNYLRKTNKAVAAIIEPLDKVSQSSALEYLWNDLDENTRTALLAEGQATMMFPRQGMTLQEVVDALPHGTFDDRRDFVYNLEKQNRQFLRLSQFRRTQSSFPSSVSRKRVYGADSGKLVSASWMDPNNPHALPAHRFAIPGNTGYELNLSGANTGQQPYGVHLPYRELWQYLTQAEDWDRATGRPTIYGAPFPTLSAKSQGWGNVQKSGTWFVRPQDKKAALAAVVQAMQQLEAAAQAGYLSGNDIVSGHRPINIGTRRR